MAGEIQIRGSAGNEFDSVIEYMVAEKLLEFGGNLEEKLINLYIQEFMVERSVEKQSANHP